MTDMVKKMRLLHFAAGMFSLITFLAGSLPAQQSSVEGIVINRTNEKPIDGVHVRFILGIDIQQATLSYGAITDAAGRFSVASMQPGYYTVDWERTGFLPGMGKEPVPVRRTELELRPGEHRTGWKLEMSPLVTISGRVVNQYGDPVPNVQIHPMEDGQTSNFDTQYSGYYNIKMTDEKGRFRLFTPPGRYYIVAVPFRSSPSRTTEIRTDGTAVIVFDRTYYPAAPDTKSANVVDAQPDSNITGIEIRMRSNSLRNDTVSGVITGIPTGAHATILHQFGVRQGQFSSSGTSGVGADGRFSINLQPGYVRLLAQCISGDAVLQSEPVGVRVEAPGSDNVKLPLVHETNGTMSGALEIIGHDPSYEPADKLDIRLSSIDGVMSFSPLSAAVSDNSTFRITGIPPGHYRLYVSRMPENAYIKSILLGDVPAKEGTLDFSRGVPKERIHITISRNGAEISGEVRHADGELALNPNIAILLMPEPDQNIQPRSGGINNGHFLLKGVPPGKYKIYAADVRTRGVGIRINQPGGDPDLAAAERIEVAEGDRLTRNLTVVQEAGDGHPK